MNNNLPTWALRAAAVEDLGFAKEALRHGRLQIKWPNVNALRSWAKQQGWATPFFGFEEAFIAKLLETQENFALAMANSGIEIQVPRQTYTISSEMICELDALAAARMKEG